MLPFILTDENVAPLWLSEAKRRLRCENAVEIVIKAGEPYKNLETVQHIWETLMAHHADRNAMLINLGGGVVTDLGGFAASTYKRGIKFVNVPTTLLAMVDAAIGGKTGFDFGGAKNMIGTFAEAEEVVIEPEFLTTLPRREVLSGWAEMLKYGFIADPDLLQSNVENYSQYIKRCGELKRAIVKSDPYEYGLRKILNFGHTVGHAIESHSLTTDGPLLHGEAVALGMEAALWLSVRRCGLDEKVLHDYEKLLPSLLSEAKVRLSEADVESISAYLNHDKKNKGERQQFVLIEAVGRPVWGFEVEPELIRQALGYTLSSLRTRIRNLPSEKEMSPRLRNGGCSSSVTLKNGKVVRFGEVCLPASKSESNRAMMVAAYGGFAPEFQNLSDSHDTLVLAEALHATQSRTSTIDIADCGTAARFMATYLASSEGEWLLTGTERMRQRPMAPLVDALRALGAEIQYDGNEGCLPLRIVGKPLSGGKTSVDMTQSSQFASSLLLAAPMFPQGLELELLGSLSSLPYLEMTLAMMRHFGAEAERQGRTILVKSKPYQPTGFMVSADWTAASYWYEIAAFSEACEIRLKSLSLRSQRSVEEPKGRVDLQGDSIIADWMHPMGVGTFAEGEDLVLRKIPREKRQLSFDFSHHPDLYPTVAATCAGLGVEATFAGLDNLHIKESDRVEAMQSELAKLGNTLLHFCSHNDHRIVMALAPLSMLFGPLSFDHPEVVEKSYPRFWKDVCLLAPIWVGEK